ncbi:hypothetical protein EXIGLDRAFT_731200 [Exidia glandulosa HHB12029]|uniref:Uncharacterized protein n=1 Tax=Exidia glandulosa HHB12029 TaxID=1314781 RepID=A0A165BYS9_EXIGL|nr:hypothetical protein EXIGLDRAFT_731200 [Exidia glandulosa HHB12029]
MAGSRGLGTSASGLVPEPGPGLVGAEWSYRCTRVPFVQPSSAMTESAVCKASQGFNAGKIAAV